MREIKFRAWDVEAKAYIVEPVLIGNVYDKNRVFVFRGRTSEEVPTAIPIQYTGLKDKNGKEIYEGDVVILAGSKSPKVMEFHRGGFWLERIYGGVEAYRMEVIGNVHENPDLLTPHTI